ncbi:MAG: LCP family protein [Chloroflexi bacterium]|nr:LCP family protein [Chloroflexota bacterium]
MEHHAEPRPIRRMLGTFAMVILVAGAVYSAFLFFTTVRALVAHAEFPLVERAVPVGVAQRRSASEVQVTQLVQRKERINILLLGIDQRDNEADKGPWRTDTMILVSIDPNTNSASMLSIPRDLWVTIPGFGENRINVAHYLGDAYDYPGGGPALAKKTVWYALGVPVHYYVRINFTGFVKIIDAMGGLTINVEKPIHDEKYPDNNFGTFVLDIPAGLQHMDGERALQYARSRHGSSDYDRMARQQQVLLAIRDKALSLDIPLSQIPTILATLGDSIKTDLTLEEILALAETAQKIDRANIRYAVLDRSMTTTVVTAKGAMVEVPDWDKVRQLVNDLFPAPSPSTAPSPSLVKAQLAAEDARIIVQNGTLAVDLAQSVSATLREQGFAVMRYENAKRFDYAETLLIVYADKPYTTQSLAAALGIKAENILNRQGESTEADLVVILGRDYAQGAGRGQ